MAFFTERVTWSTKAISRSMVSANRTVSDVFAGAAGEH
jgi:hypothetical protein